MSGILTNGLPLATSLAGTELIPVDTGNTQGILPESEAASVAQVASFAQNSPGSVVVGTADNGTTQTLTAAMVSSSGASELYHTSTGGATPSLTLPTVANLLAAFPNAQNGYSYKLRVINANSGTATIVTNTGWTLTGTLTLATNTWRDFVVTVNTAAATATAVSVGTGTYS